MMTHIASTLALKHEHNFIKRFLEFGGLLQCPLPKLPHLYFSSSVRCHRRPLRQEFPSVHLSCVHVVSSWRSSCCPERDSCFLTHASLGGVWLHV